MFRAISARRACEGITLVELVVVIVIIGALAAFGMPRFMTSVERTRVARAFAYLSAVRDAQERYRDREGKYATDLRALDIPARAPKFFTVGALGPGPGPRENSWKLALTRTGAASTHGSYTIVFTARGYDTSSTIDAIPAINPMSALGPETTAFAGP